MSAIRRDYLAALFVLLVPVLTTLHAAETVTEPEHASSDFARLTLPTTIYAVPGVETSLYFANANRSDDTHWNLWTREQDIDKKRSGGAVLASPGVKADRATPDEGAPPLHSVVPGLKPGWYRVFASAPGRPLAYSLDGKKWFKHQGSELPLGLWQATDKPFELWVDDRYAYPTGNPGPGYYDYLRFVACAPPTIENVETFSPEPGKASVCWTTNVPLATGWVELGDGPAAAAENTSSTLARNHQVLLDGLDPNRTYRARVVTGLGTSRMWPNASAGTKHRV